MDEEGELKKRLDCLILLNCLGEASEKEKLKIAVNCLGLTETAKLIGRDPSNLSKSVNNKWIKKNKNNTEGGEENAKEE